MSKAPLSYAFRHRNFFERHGVKHRNICKDGYLQMFTAQATVQPGS